MKVKRLTALMNPFFALCLLVIFVQPVYSEQPTKKTGAAFVYDGGAIRDLGDEFDDWDDKDKRYWTAYWNPSPTKIRKPGFHIAFWGSASGCSKNVLNGPTFKADKPTNDKKNKQPEMIKKFTPLPDKSVCSASENQNPAEKSFVTIDESGSQGTGITLYTYAGKKGKDKGFGFLPHPASGGRAGVNSDIIGTFVSFRFSSKDESVKPWNDRVLRILTRQGIASVHVAKNSPPKTQAKQQLTISFVNNVCLQTNKDSATKCHLQILLNTSIERQGLQDWRDNPRFTKSSVLFDKAQGGIPVLRGLFGHKGVATKLHQKGGEGVVTWVSEGDATFNGAQGEGDFALTMTFEQFKNVLLHIASLVSESQDKRGIVNVYGKNWDDPDSWSVLTVKFAQEVHNVDLNKPSLIKGYMKSLIIE
jgi:hypothetical protein